MLALGASYGSPPFHMQIEVKPSTNGGRLSALWRHQYTVMKAWNIQLKKLLFWRMFYLDNVEVQVFEITLIYDVVSDSVHKAGPLC